MAMNTIVGDHEVSGEELGFSSQEEKEIERALADISFEELQKARSDGSHTARVKRGKNEKLGRANKNRPSELSCKVPVGRSREVIQAPKKVVRDPRFESLCGTLDPVGRIEENDSFIQPQEFGRKACLFPDMQVEALR